MEKKYGQCPHCAHTGQKLIAQESFQGKDYEVSSCTNCGLIYTSYQSDDTNEYYGHDMKAWQEKYNPIITGQAKHDRDLNYLEEVALIRKITGNKGNFLDIGCNAGWLLSYLQKGTNLTLHGLEPSKVLSQITTDRLKVKVYNSYVQENVLPDVYFDCMTMTDVFEHIPNPHQVLSVLKKSLKPGGYLIIKVPNGRFTEMKYRLRHLIPWLMNNKDHFNAKEHLIHFTPESLKNVLEKNGFSIAQQFVPLPIQTRGSSKVSILARDAVYYLSKAKLLPPQDLFVVAQNH